MELQNQNLGLLSRAHLEDVLDDFDQAALYQFHVEPHYGQYVLNLVRVRVGVQRADGIPIDWDEFYEWLSTRRCCQHCRRASGGVEAVIRRSTSLNNWQYWRSDRRTGPPMMYMDWLSHANTWAHANIYILFCGIAPTDQDWQVPLDVVQELHSRMMFAIIHCQLSPIDARSIIPLLDQHNPPLNQLARIVLPQSLEQAVNNALVRYYVGWDRQLEDGDQLRLMNDSDIGYLSFEQSITNTWIVMATPKKALDKTKIGHGMLSCYFDQHMQQEMIPVVLLPQLQVRRSHAPVMMFFNRHPDIDMVQMGLNHLQQELLTRYSLTGNIAWLNVTIPFQYSADFGPQYRIFKSDGRLDLTVWKKYLSSRLRSAQQFQHVEENGWDANVEPLAVAVALPMPIPTIPINAGQSPAGIILLYLRASSGDKHIYGSGLAKQLCYMLPRIQDLVRESTKLYVIAECNSSSMYRWQNRNMWIQFYNSLEQDHGPIAIVTATPDRLTRRPEDLPLIHAQFSRQRCRWFSFNVLEENHDQLVQVDEDQHQDLAAKLTLSMVSITKVFAKSYPSNFCDKNVFLQYIYYNRCCEQMAKTVNQIREIQELEANGNATVVWKIAFIRAQRQLVTRFCLERYITRIVIVSRTGPEWSKRQNDKNSEPSLSLQEHFCHQFVDQFNGNIQVEQLQINGESAFGQQTMRRLTQHIGARGDILLLASSIERLTRRQEQLLDMLTWQERNTWVMSFLWPLRRELPYPTDPIGVARFINIAPQQLQDLQLVQDIASGFARTIALRSTIYGHPVVMPMVLSDHNLPIVGAAVSDAEYFVTRNIDIMYRSTELPQNAPRYRGTQRGISRRWEDFWKAHVSQTTGKLQPIFT
ncbi:hypothetical protein NQZ79_g1614 [Umbelopsis isabellina]|nr:hypothetical protein NQZ79_g1614 [Umbelopsis isabellina]